MSKKLISVFTALVIILTLIPANQALAYRDSVVEVTQTYSTSDNVTVAVKMHNMRNLNAGSLQVSVDHSGVDLDSFEPAPKFDKGTFTTTSRTEGDALNISFLASGSNEVDIDSSVLGYITYDVDSSVSEGEKIAIDVQNASFKDADDEELVEVTHDGAIYYERSMGDVNDNQELNAAQAMKILQHANGSSTLSGEDLKFADIDGDGNISQKDAKELLEFIVGKKTSMMRIQTDEVNSAFVDVPYSLVMKANYGQAPYTWDAESLPSGLEINEETGEIFGTPRDIETETIDVTVEDRTGAEMSKSFDLSVSESDIKQIEQISPITVQKGEQLNLPSSIQVTYNDGTTSNEDVEWGTVNTSSVGEYTISGEVGDTQHTTSVQVIVFDGEEKPYVPEDQIIGVTTDYVGFLDVHTITVEVTDKVSRMEVISGRTEIEMNADVDSTFSLATPRLGSGDVVTVVAYDYFNEKITERKVTLK